MAKLNVMAVKDMALDAYMQPWIARTTAMAQRAFSDEVNKSDSPIKQHPEHYALFHIADWDDETGIFSNNQPRQVILATDCIKS